MLTLSAEWTAALDSKVAAFRWLLELQRKTATDRFWTGQGNVSFGGNTYFGLADPSGKAWAAIGDHEQDVTGSFPPVSITFAIEDPAYLVLIGSSDEFRERPANFYRAIWDADVGALLPGTLHAWQRIMRVGPYNRRSKTWTLYFESPLFRQLRRWQRVRAHQDQREWAEDVSGGAETNDQGLISVTNFPRGRVEWPGPRFKITRGT